MKTTWSDLTPTYQRKLALALMSISLIVSLISEYGGVKTPSLTVASWLILLASVIICSVLARRTRFSSRFRNGVSFHKEDEYNLDRLLNMFTIIGCLGSALITLYSTLS